jgi:RND family efflux transporter MFP subunit
MIKDEIFKHKEIIKSLEQELAKTGEKRLAKKAVKVVVKQVVRESVRHSFRSTGTVKAKQIAYISPQMNGQIEEILVREGQHVKKGQLLIKLNSDVLLSSILELKTGLSLSSTLYEKQKTLWKQGIGKEIDYLQAKNRKESLEAKLRTMRAQLKMTKITAPFSGIVDHIYSKVGEMASPVRQVLDLVNLDQMEVEVEISEKYLPYIQAGDSLSVRFPTYKSLEKQACVDRIGNIINVANRTFRILVNVENQDHKIKPNMIAEVLLSDYQGMDFVIPSIIIKKDRKGKFVYVVKEVEGKTYADKRYIKTGLNIEDNTIVEDGIHEGDRLITQGYNLVNTDVLIDIQ